jgi:hypothetical protein
MKKSVKSAIDFPARAKQKGKENTYVQAWVEDKYWVPVASDLARKKIKIREFIELCVKLYIIKYLPQTAAKLGLKAESL